MDAPTSRPDAEAPPRELAAESPGALRRYAIALLVTGAAFDIRYLLEPALLGHQPFAIFYLAVGLAAWWTGTIPAIMSAVVGLVAGYVFFLRPHLVAGMNPLIPVAMYVVVTGCVIGMVRHARRSDLKARRSATRTDAAEHALVEREAMLAGLAESVLDGILIVPAAGGPLYSNAQFRRMWQTPPGVLDGRTEDAVLAWAETQVADPRGFRGGIARIYADPQRAIREEVEMKDGRVFERFGGPVTEGGRRTGWVWTFRDITARKGTERQLRESEQHLRRVLDNLYAFVGVMTPDGTLVEANRAPLEFAGISARDVIGKKLWETHWWSHAAEWQERLRAAIHRANQGELVRFDAPVRMNGGALMWIDFQLAPLRDESGRITHLIPSAMDITERRRTAESLRHATTLLQAISDHSADVIFAKDREGRLTFANPATLALVGKPLEQVLGRTDAELLEDKEAAAAVMETDRRIMQTQTAEELEEAVPLPDGGRRVWLSRKMPYRDPNGKVIGLLGISRDITARKEAERALREREHQFRQAFAHAPVGMALTDLEGRLLHVNRAYCDITGYSEQELLAAGMNFKRLTYAADLNRNLHAFQKLLAGEIPAFFVEKRYVRKDDKVVWVRASASLRRDAEGRPYQIVGLVEDITERKRTEAALQEAKEKAERSHAEQEAIVNSMTEGVGIFDANGMLLDINPAGVAMHGFANADDMRRQIAQLERLFVLQDVAGRDLPLERWPVMRVLNGETFTHYEVVVVRRDASRRFIGSYGGAPVRDSEGRVVLAIITVRDVTEQREAERALASANAQLERHANELEATVAQRTAQLRETIHELEAFSYSLSHDMRAPLRAMRGFAEILETEHSGQLDSAARLYLRRISAAAARLDQLIRDVLTYSRIVEEKIDLQPIDVEKLIHQLIDENPALQPPRAQIEVGEPLDAMIGHEAYLMQVLSNLVYNGVKFVAAGATPRLRIWTERRDERVRLFVRDNGIGIPSEAHERMFRMFERMHSEKDYEGTGIGLAIVRKAVERMGGVVGVDSEPGQGSTFWVDLRKP